MGRILASVILPVYDAPKSLTFVLEGFRRQSTKNFELIIADDGSPPEMKAIVQEFAKTASFEVKYLWHEDKGFRKPKAANEGVKISRGKWLIFCDGDCIPHYNFVMAHLEAAKPDSVAVGLGIYFPPAYCQALTPKMVAQGDYEKYLSFPIKARLYISHLRDIFTRGSRFKDTDLIKDNGAATSLADILIGRPRTTTVTGGNFSCDRELFYAVNGFDENLNDIMAEDLELGRRLYRGGGKFVDLWHSACVFELACATDKSRLTHSYGDGNLAAKYLQRPNIPIRCENGLIKEGAYAKVDYDLPKIGLY